MQTLEPLSLAYPAGPLQLKEHARLFVNGPLGVAVYSMGATSQETEDFARRIVSCVNLLAGHSTEDIVRGHVKVSGPV